MDIKEAKKQIKNTVIAYLTKDENGLYKIPVHKQRPVFLMGPPGIGKTAIMEQIASEMGIGLLSYSMTHHTRQSALGLPMIKQVTYGGQTYDISEYTMSEIIASIYQLMEESGVRQGILFLDEINCVSETLTPIMLQFLQYKVFGRHRVPDGWVVVTAGNPPEYNNSVREYDIVTWDRLKRIDVTADFNVWKEFAYEHGVHAAVLSYLSNDNNYTKRFYNVQSSVDGMYFVTARGWDDLSQMLQLYEEHDMPVDVSLIRQYIQNPEIASHFASYYDLYRKYRSDYQVWDILSGKDVPEIEKRARNARFDERYSLLSLLLEAVMSKMREVMEEHALLEALLGYLKQIKSQTVSRPEDTIGLMEQSLASIRKDYKAALRANSLTDDQKALKLRTIRFFEEQLTEIKKRAAEYAHPFDVVNEAYYKVYNKWTEDAKQAVDYTNNMFLFAERVYPHGQELAILVAELVVNPHAASFLKVHRVEEYFKHDRSLLMEERKREIRSMIDDMNL